MDYITLYSRKIHVVVVVFLLKTLFSQAYHYKRVALGEGIDPLSPKH